MNEATRAAYEHYTKRAITNDFPYIDPINRRVMFSDHVNDHEINRTLAFINVLIYLDKKPVTLVINSTGGEVYAALKFYDLIRELPVSINTLVAGTAMSAAAIMACAPTGTRAMTANSHLMIHEVSSWEIGEVSKLKKRIQHTDNLQTLIVNLLTKHCGVPPEKTWEQRLSEETYLSPEEALKLKMIDNII